MDANTSQSEFNAAILSTVASLVAVLDSDGRIIFFNTACEKVTGYRFEEVENRYVWDLLISEEQIDTVKNVFKRLVEGDHPSHFVNYWVAKNGERRLIDWSNTCLLDEYGNVEYVIPTGVDITEKHKAEKKLKQSEEQKNLILNATAEAIYGVDVDGMCTFVNKAFIEQLGYQDSQQLIGQNIHALIHHTYPDGQPYPKEQCHVRKSTREGKSTHVDNEVHWRADGSSFPVEYWSHPIEKNGQLLGAVVTFIDISARKQAEDQMLKLTSAIEQTADAIMITDVNGVIEYVNPAFEKMTGYSPNQVIGQKPSVLKSGRHDNDFFSTVWKELLIGNVYKDVFVNKRLDGTLFYEEKTIAPVKNNNESITHFISTSRDITDRIEAEERLHHLAHHDLLTDLPNRTLFLDRLNQSLARARWHGRTVAVLFLDIDHFKKINDSYGHEFGDEVIKIFSHRLKNSLRDRDTVGRLGGDEFVVLLDDVAQKGDIEKLVDKIIESLHFSLKVGDESLCVTTSIGISMFPLDGDDSSVLLRHADKAMYQAKQEPGNSFIFYQPVP